MKMWVARQLKKIAVLGNSQEGDKPIEIVPCINKLLNTLSREVDNTAEVEDLLKDGNYLAGIREN